MKEESNNMSLIKWESAIVLRIGRWLKITKKLLASNKNCNCCFEQYDSNSFYCLTPSQIVVSKKFWDFVMTRPGFISISKVHFYDKDVNATEIRGKKVIEISSYTNSWFICENCIKLFDIDKVLAKQYAIEKNINPKFNPPNNGDPKTIIPMKEYMEIIIYACALAGSDLLKNIVKNNLNDIDNFTPQAFESFLLDLNKIPEEDWFKGRREPLLLWLEKYELKNPDKIDRILFNHSPNMFYTIEKIEIIGEIYIYFDEIIKNPNDTIPTINWFQIEKLSTTYGPNFYKPKLLLSSDDHAVAQGMIILTLYDAYKKNNQQPNINDF